MIATSRSHEAVIGLEVHAELLTRSKMFCGCAVVDSTVAEPNTSVCEICTGMPGTLPVINEQAVAYGLMVALALECEIPGRSVFARKNYFYPDLPKGYQISQYELPLAQNGSLLIDLPTGSKQIHIRRVHLEEDTGKLSHEADYSLVDYNRSGVPLLEIVSEPDMASLEEVKAYATSLRSLLQYLGVNSGDMEKGVIRFEANVSVRPAGSQRLNTRTEIKNLNSFRGMLRAVEYEIERQISALEAGEEIIQQTLGWDETAGVTVAQRSKEEAHDYRYFPEPDLPPLVIDRDWIRRLQAEIPELPRAKQQRYIAELKLPSYLAGVLSADRSVAEYFEAALEASPRVDPQKLANWLSVDLFSLLNEVG
ncbi:MAG: Asp-tRNA(Asn)/Glu-tRNA(Gln) amidotransferase subunit GatB, partial [Anaerolineales bacterium]